MSVFEVKMQHIAQMEPHPNADKLELVVIGGYRAVVQKDVHKVGDLILYIPEGTVFTDMDIAAKLGVGTYLTGKYKNRVNAIRLRGIVSQGIVLPQSIVDETLAALGFGYYSFREGIDFHEELKLEKYEEPIPIEMMGHVRPWPSFMHQYDLENIRRPESMAAMHPGETVVMTEKIHGANMAVAIGPGLEEGEPGYVCQRRFAMAESDTNVFWRAAKKYDLLAKLRAYKESLEATGQVVESISLHGELIGVQNLKYGHVNGDVGFRAFDIRLNGAWLSFDDFLMATTLHDIPVVPLLYRGPYDYDRLKGLAEGPTTLGAGHIREGGVVKPIVERHDQWAGRVCFKFVSDAYLLKYDADKTG